MSTGLAPETERLASDFITAVERGDIDTIRREIYAPDAVIWHNTDGREIGPEDNFRVLRWLCSTVKDLRYEDQVRYPIPGGYAQRHVLRGVTPGGEELTVRACFFVTVANGRIVRLDEYLDSAASRCLDPYRPTSR